MRSLRGGKQNLVTGSKARVRDKQHSLPEFDKTKPNGRVGLRIPRVRRVHASPHEQKETHELEPTSALTMCSMRKPSARGQKGYAVQEMPNLQTKLINARQVSDGAATGDVNNVLGGPPKVEGPTTTHRDRRKHGRDANGHDFAIRQKSAHQQFPFSFSVKHSFKMGENGNDDFDKNTLPRAKDVAQLQDALPMGFNTMGGKYVSLAIAKVVPQGSDTSGDVVEGGVPFGPIHRNRVEPFSMRMVVKQHPKVTISS